MVAKGLAPLRRELPRLVDDEATQLSGLFRAMLGEMAERLKYLDRRIDEYDLKVVGVFGQDERCQRLAKVEGVGPLTATALVAAVGNAHEFKSGRELSAWPGLVPRQHSSGGRMCSWASASAAIATCARCSFMELALPCVRSSGARIHAASRSAG